MDLLRLWKHQIIPELPTCLAALCYVLLCFTEESYVAVSSLHLGCVNSTVIARPNSVLPRGWKIPGMP